MIHEMQQGCIIHSLWDVKPNSAVDSSCLTPSTSSNQHMSVVQISNVISSLWTKSEHSSAVMVQTLNASGQLGLV